MGGAWPGAGSLCKTVLGLQEWRELELKAEALVGPGLEAALGPLLLLLAAPSLDQVLAQDYVQVLVCLRRPASELFAPSKPLPPAAGPEQSSLATAGLQLCCTYTHNDVNSPWWSAVVVIE